MSYGTHGVPPPLPVLPMNNPSRKGHKHTGLTILPGPQLFGDITNRSSSPNATSTPRKSIPHKSARSPRSNGMHPGALALDSTKDDQAVAILEEPPKSHSKPSPRSKTITAITLDVGADTSTGISTSSLGERTRGSSLRVVTSASLMSDSKINMDEKKIYTPQPQPQPPNEAEKGSCTDEQSSPSEYTRITLEIEKEQRIIDGVNKFKKVSKRGKKIRQQAEHVKGTAEAKLRFYHRELSQILTVSDSDAAAIEPPRRYSFDALAGMTPTSKRASYHGFNPSPSTSHLNSPRRDSVIDSPSTQLYASASASPAVRSMIPLSRLERQLRIEEKVKEGAENLVAAYGSPGHDRTKSSTALAEHARNMVADSKNKVSFLKTEMLRRQVCPQLGTSDEDLTQKFSRDVRSSEVLRKIAIEKSLQEGALRMVAKADIDRRVNTEAKKTLFESSSKLRMLKLSQQKLIEAGSTQFEEDLLTDSVKESQTANQVNDLGGRMSPAEPDFTGRFHVKVVRAEGLYVSDADSKLEPFVVLKIGSHVAARTKPWTQPFCYPHWNQQLALEFHRGRECELHCYSDKENMCGVQFLKIGDFLDGHAHTLKLPLEPQGVVEVVVQFENALLAPDGNFPKRKIRRRMDVLHFKWDKGSKLIRANDLGIGIATWTRLLRDDTLMRRQTLHQRRQHLAAAETATKPESDPVESFLLVPNTKSSQGLQNQESKLQTFRAGAPNTSSSSGKFLTMSDFDLLYVLGRGHFGKVMLAERIDTRELIAIKCVRKAELLARDELDSMVIERNVFQCITAAHHPFLVSLVATFQTKTHICFAMEYTPGGDLLAQIQIRIFDEDRARFYTACVLQALKFLHDNHIVYRDLKLDNLLIDRDGYIKVADYGLCKENMMYGDRTSTFCGTPEFIAPEVLTQNDYTIAVDWWGLGVLMYEMLVGEAPFPGETEEQIFESIVHDDVQIPFYLSMTTSNIIRKLLQKNPTKRLGAGPSDAIDVMKHMYFRSIDWDKLLDRQLKAPFVPKLRGRLDIRNFDSAFTDEEAALNVTPPAGGGIGHLLLSKDQKHFEGFEFTESSLFEAGTGQTTNV